MSFSAVLSYLPGLVVGGLVGYAYHRVIGCAGGACPIVANPYLSTLYGVLFGAILQSGR